MTDRDPPRAHTYRDAGVDHTGGSRAKERIGALIRDTYTDGVAGDFGHFGSLFRSPAGEGNILVSSADSVGTKVLLAVHAGKHQSIGIDLVNHCVNDILCCGARPLFFLDYFATSSLDETLLADLVAGMASACRQAGCALIGGETAQLPGIYREGTYDLAGFIVGTVHESEIIDGSRVHPGQAIVGFESDGLHTNGYSLARSVFTLSQDDPAATRSRLDQHQPELGESLGDALLRPHRSYLPTISELASSVRATAYAHITGGGIAGNLERVIPDNCTAAIDTRSWPRPPLFELIQRTGNVASSEMFDVFNMGIGFIAIVDRSSANRIVEDTPDAHLIGEVRPSSAAEQRVELRGIENG